MQVFSDYIFSVIIAGIVLLIVLSLKFRGEQTSIDATQYRAAKVGTLSLVEAINRDFNNIGSQYLRNTHANLSPDTVLIAFDTLANPAHFAFWAQTDSVRWAQQVRYEWRLTGKTVRLKNGTKPLLEVKRLVDGVLQGRSTNMITRFEVHLQQASSLAFTNLRGANADTQQILVRLRAVSPLGVGDSVEETRWEKMFRPANLWKRRDV